MTTREQVIHELSKRYPTPGEWNGGSSTSDVERESRCTGGRGTTCGISGREIRGAR
jgi:hypothetical protein